MQKIMRITAKFDFVFYQGVPAGALISKMLAEGLDPALLK